MTLQANGSYGRTLLAALVLLLAACAPASTSVPAPTPESTDRPAPTPSLAPSSTPTPPPSATPKPTLAPTVTLTWTPKPTPASAPTPPPTPIPSLIPHPEGFRTVAVIEEVLPSEFRRLHASADGTLWLITDAGIARLEDGTWRAYLTDFSGDLVGFDAAGRAWVVSEETDTISAWDGSSWTVYRAEAGWLPIALEDEWYREIGWMQTDDVGRLWLATSQDVRTFDSQRWTVFTPAQMGMGQVGPQQRWPTFTIEVAESSGTVWVGECDWCGPGPFGGQGVRWFDGQAWRGADSPAAAGCTTAIEEDGQGHVWMGVDERLWRYDSTSGDWTQLTPPESPIIDMRFGFVDAIAVGPSRVPWPAMVLCGASCYGKTALYRVEDGDWMQMAEVKEFGGNLSPYKFVSNEAGGGWLLWAGSLYRVAEGRTEPVPGLGLVSDILVDTAGRLWLVARDQGQDVLWTLDMEPATEP